MQRRVSSVPGMLQHVQQRINFQGKQRPAREGLKAPTPSPLCFQNHIEIHSSPRILRIPKPFRGHGLSGRPHPPRPPQRSAARPRQGGRSELPNTAPLGPRCPSPPWRRSSSAAARPPRGGPSLQPQSAASTLSQRSRSHT
eukprot:s3010_g5.t1